MGFDITLHDRGGHGSRPDLAVNPVDCFVAIYNGLQAARLTKVTPFAPLTLSIGLVGGRHREKHHSKRPAVCRDGAAV